MKVRALMMLTALLLFPGQPVMAAQVAADFAAAEKKVKDAGYIAFIYPAGWDRYGERFCRRLLADKKVLAAAGDTVLLAVPIYQNPTEEQKKLAERMRGRLAYPGDMSDISYPALVFYEKGGRQYASLHGERLMKSTPEQVAELVRSRVAAKKKQDALLKKANAAAEGRKKALLLLESSRVSGLEWPGGLREAIQKADPQDSSGAAAALSFSFSPARDETLTAFLKRLDTVLENPVYTNDQKQRACAAAIGHVRRSVGMIAGGSIIERYARNMRALNPDSPLGLAAPVIMRDWVREYRYGQGWSPEVLPGQPIPMVMKGVPISAPGTYTVTFRIVTGRDALAVNKLRLLDGNRCVAEDTTARAVTWSATTQVYTLSVKEAVKNPALEITFGNTPDKRSTWGDITVTAQ